MNAPARHKLHTQEGKNRYEKPAPALIDLSVDEKALRALYRRLQYFPTPPWATRALVKMIDAYIDAYNIAAYVLEPAAGRGHIVETLRAAQFIVRALDIHNYGKGYDVGDFLTTDFDGETFDLVVTNPPFSDKRPRGEPTIADRFIAKALTLAPHVFVFARRGFLTPAIRFPLMRDHLEAEFVFIERVPIALGRISKKSGATDYAWYYFRRNKTMPAGEHRTILIPPGTRQACTKPGDSRL